MIYTPITSTFFERYLVQGGTYGGLYIQHGIPEGCKLLAVEKNVRIGRPDDYVFWFDHPEFRNSKDVYRPVFWSKIGERVNVKFKEYQPRRFFYESPELGEDR